MSEIGFQLNFAIDGAQGRPWVTLIWNLCTAFTRRDDIDEIVVKIATI